MRVAGVVLIGLLAVGCATTARPPTTIASHTGAAAPIAPAVARNARAIRADDIPWLTPRKPGRVVVVSTTITILDRIQFVGASALITPSSKPILDAVASSLVGNPSITLLEVEAHGLEAPVGAQLHLARERADYIVDELVARGVERKRLRAGWVAIPERADDGMRFIIVTRSTDSDSTTN